MKKVYIAGPITIDKEHYKEHFQKAAEFLTASGYEVINPALDEYDDQAYEAGHTDKWTPEAWLFYMQRDMELVSKCNAIYLLKGWEQSSGATIEKIVATKFGLDIMYEV